MSDSEILIIVGAVAAFYLLTHNQPSLAPAHSGTPAPAPSTSPNLGTEIIGAVTQITTTAINAYANSSSDSGSGTASDPSSDDYTP